MPSLAVVYEKFGEVAEAAQLLETQIGNLLLSVTVAEKELTSARNRALAKSIFSDVDRKTLGQLIKALQAKSTTPADLERSLGAALQERNRLNHAFYRKHNFRRNSDDGRALMLQDLEGMHQTILEAYKTVLLLSGIDLEDPGTTDLPTKHLPLDIR